MRREEEQREQRRTNILENQRRVLEARPQTELSTREARESEEEGSRPPDSESEGAREGLRDGYSFLEVEEMCEAIGERVWDGYTPTLDDDGETIYSPFMPGKKRVIICWWERGGVRH